MGESKKINVTKIAPLCSKWLPAFRTADKLKEIGVHRILDSPNFVSLSDIVFNSLYGASGVHRILKAGIRAGIVEKNPAGGRGPLYRGTERLRGVLAATVKTDALYFISHFEDIFYTLNIDPHNQSALCEYIGGRQATVSLQMKRLISAGLIDRDQRGKEVWYSLSEHARRVMPLIENELRVL